MGEMIKFGIKIALTVACAVALMAAIIILYNLITSIPSINTNSSYFLWEMFRVVGLCLPFDVKLVFNCITTLFAFKVAYWAADKMIQFINALG